MIAVGVDIVDIERFALVGKRTPRLLWRVFTSVELNYCENKGGSWASLAARFAVREAFRKLDGSFTNGLSFQDVSVVNDERGRPTLLLSPTAAVKAQQAGFKHFSISLSHSREQAIAVIIGEGGSGI